MHNKSRYIHIFPLKLTESSLVFFCVHSALYCIVLPCNGLAFLTYLVFNREKVEFRLRKQEHSDRVSRENCLLIRSTTRHGNSYRRKCMPTYLASKRMEEKGNGWTDMLPGDTAKPWSSWQRRWYRETLPVTQEINSQAFTTGPKSDFNEQCFRRHCVSLQKGKSFFQFHSRYFLEVNSLSALMKREIDLWRYNIKRQNSSK